MRACMFFGCFLTVAFEPGFRNSGSRAHSRRELPDRFSFYVKGDNDQKTERHPCPEFPDVSRESCNKRKSLERSSGFFNLRCTETLTEVGLLWHPPPLDVCARLASRKTEQSSTAWTVDWTPEAFPPYSCCGRSPIQRGARYSSFSHSFLRPAGCSRQKIRSSNGSSMLCTVERNVRSSVPALHPSHPPEEPLHQQRLLHLPELISTFTNLSRDPGQHCSTISS